NPNRHILSSLDRALLRADRFLKFLSDGISVRAVVGCVGPGSEYLHEAKAEVRENAICKVGIWHSRIALPRFLDEVSMSAVPTTEAQVFVSLENEEARYLPEGPRAITGGGRNAIAWVNIQLGADVPRGAVHLRYWDSGEQRLLPQPSRPGFLLATARPGVAFLGREKELGTLDLASGTWTSLATIPDDDPRTIIN